MPTIMGTVETEVELDFELYCGECGKGICGNATVKKTYNRGANRVDIDACSCMTDKIKELEEQIEELEKERAG